MRITLDADTLLSSPKAIPDVAAQADLFKIFLSGRAVSIGGTSAAAPTFAGIVSLLNSARLAAHLARAEPGSLAGMIARTPAGPNTDPEQQVPQWLFAFDATGIATFRALALLAAHADYGEQARWEAQDVAAHPTLPLLRAAVLEHLLQRERHRRLYGAAHQGERREGRVARDLAAGGTHGPLKLCTGARHVQGETKPVRSPCGEAGRRGTWRP